MTYTDHNMKSVEKVERYKLFDIARGIGILAVIAGHLFSRYFGVGQFLYSFHMPLFFFISGILLYVNRERYRQQSMKEFLCSRAKSLLYPYYVFVVLLVPFLIGTEGVQSALRSVLYALIFDGYKTLWFLPALFFAELLAYLMIFRVKSRLKYLLLPVMILLTTCFSSVDYRSFDGQKVYALYIIINVLCRILVGTICLLIGYELFGRIILERTLLNNNLIEQPRPMRHLPNREWILYTVGAAGLIGNLILYRWNYVDLHYMQLGNPVLFYLNAVFGGCWVLAASQLICRCFQVGSRICKYFGVHSMIVYLTHRNFNLTVLAKQLAYRMYHPTALAGEWEANYVICGIAFVFVVVFSIVIIEVTKRYLKCLTDHKNVIECVNKAHIK